MSRRIEGEELNNIQFAINEAVEAAKTSTCQRDHRGAVVFKDREILASTSNGPLLPFQCNIDICGNVCGLLAMHAERLAIIHALEQQADVTNASVLHVRIDEEGLVQISGDLRCEDCTGFMRRVGRNKKDMKLKEFILLQQDGWIAYDITEADEITRRNLGL